MHTPMDDSMLRSAVYLVDGQCSSYQWLHQSLGHGWHFFSTQCLPSRCELLWRLHFLRNEVKRYPLPAMDRAALSLLHWRDLPWRQGVFQKVALRAPAAPATSAAAIAAIACADIWRGTLREVSSRLAICLPCVAQHASAIGDAAPVTAVRLTVIDTCHAPMQAPVGVYAFVVLSVLGMINATHISVFIGL